MTAIAIRRRRGRAPLEARDLETLRLVAPHLLLAWRTCQTLTLYRRAATAAGVVAAIVDVDGQLQVADHQFLTAHPVGVLARLTAREREAALALLAGRPYADCALQLGISVNTLRNTIARVYRKLGVAGKLELAQRVGFVVPAAR